MKTYLEPAREIPVYEFDVVVAGGGTAGAVAAVAAARGGARVALIDMNEEKLADTAAQLIAKAGGKNMFLLYTIIVWGSVLFSAFIDNIPYVATMLPVITGITRALGVEPYLLYFGLLTGATLGGNLTPIGASANITATGLLKKEGFSVSFGDFMKIGVPFTLTAVLAGYLFVWFVWAPL